MQQDALIVWNFSELKHENHLKSIERFCLCRCKFKLVCAYSGRFEYYWLIAVVLTSLLLVFFTYMHISSLEVIGGGELILNSFRAIDLRDRE